MRVVHFLGFTAADVTKIEALFVSKGWLVIFFGSLPVLSSKLTAMAAGAFGYPVGKFLLVSFIIRGGRFIAMGFLIRYGGEHIREWLDRKQQQKAVPPAA